MNYYSPIPRVMYSLHIIRAHFGGFAPMPDLSAFLRAKQRALRAY